jgi:hypothetical protein
MWKKGHPCIECMGISREMMFFFPSTVFTLCIDADPHSSDITIYIIQFHEISLAILIPTIKD